MTRPLRWRIGDAIDEFAHRRLGFGWAKAESGKAHLTHWWWRYTPFFWLCNRRELSYGVPIQMVYPNTTTTNTSFPAFRSGSRRAFTTTLGAPGETSDT